MKAITIWQPYASLIAEGVKTIETRSWPAPAALVGERIAIHAGQKFVPCYGRGLGGFLAIPTITDPAYQGPQPCDSVTGRQRRIPKRAQTPTLFWPHTGPHARLREDKPEYSVTQYLPLGAVVATARLVACVPMVELGADEADGYDGGPACWEQDGHWLYDPDTLDESADRIQVITPQRPYGDFAPGRWAWMLTDIAPTTERCPADCRIIAGDGEDDFDAERGGHRVLTGTTKVGGGTLEAWATCPVCDGAGKCEPIPAKGRQRLWEWTR